jgi:hypothetical protein
VICPDSSVVAIGGDEHAGVVDSAHAERFRRGTSSVATR